MPSRSYLIKNLLRHNLPKKISVNHHVEGRCFRGTFSAGKKNGPHPLYVLTGDEPLLVMELQDQLRAMVIAHGHTEREVMVQEKGFDWSSLMNAGQTMSLFGDKR
ncbi:MAG: hypothetical protein ACKOPD_03425, partial [Polynucleobacter victoriensis]